MFDEPVTGFQPTFVDWLPSKPYEEHTVSVSAILLVGNRSILPATWDGSSFESESAPAETPTACVEVLGASVLERTCANLQKAGVRKIVVAIAESLTSLVSRSVRKKATVVPLCAGSNEAQEVDRLVRFRLDNANTVVLMRINAYLDFDLADILRCHQFHQARTTRVYDDEAPLDFWVINASEATCSELISRGIEEDARYFLSGYVNHLRTAADFRRLVVDALRRRCQLKPYGREIRPGVWIAEGARVHACARIVAPAFIGRKAKVCASALMTRCSSVEGGSTISSGTTVEDSSILARTWVGARLDVSHAVIDGSKCAHLTRDVTVEINDPKLLHKIDRWRFLKALLKSTPRVRQQPGNIAIVPSVSAVPAAAYVNSSKEQYDNWESCNRQAIT
jgi:NDP-sugar pyrophosphorylase family protein